MGQPGAKKLDQIVSVTPGDVHMIQPPGPSPPVPVPHPVPNSLINDEVAEKVKVMGFPGAVKGSISQHTPPHIPIGGTFVNPPKNKGKITTGSANVFYEGKAAAAMGDTAEMCMDPSDAPVGKVIGKAAMVLVGGGGSGSDEARAQASAQAMKAAAAACHKWINANMPPGADREQAHRNLCTATGHPIDVATGKLFTRSIDLELPGRIPFQFIRNYSSARPERGILGWGWRHAYQIDLVVNREFVAHRDANGRFLPFAPVAVGAKSTNETGGLLLHRTSDAYWVEDGSGLSQKFSTESGAGSSLLLSAIEDPFGNRIEFSYENRRLTRVRDSAGRKVKFEYDEQGRIKGLLLENPVTFQFEPVCYYDFDESDDLIAVRDSANKAIRYEYANHLLVREADRINFSFYFCYDADGWCRETWGDGGLLYRRMDYDRKKRCTRVCNSEGHCSLYRWNENGLVETEIDPLGHEWSFRFDDAQHKISATDPLGKAWLYEYDKAGRLVARTDPNGKTVVLEYDKLGRRTACIDGEGQAWSMRYNTSGQLFALLDPDNNTVGLEWSPRGDLVASVDEIGRRTLYRYDDAGNMVERRTKRGLVVERGYDHKGRLLHETDPLGPRVRFEYDQRGRVTAEFWRDRGKISYEHDDQGNITKMTDAAGRTTTYAYGQFNKVLKRTAPGDNNGSNQTIQDYDSEGRLKAVTYPGGRRAEYGYDADGRISWKLCVDGRKLNYVRNAAGFVTEVYDNGGLIARYELDGLGRIIKRETVDGEVTTFDYDTNGRLVGAANDQGRVEIKYDTCGRVTGETGPFSSIRKAYDPAGRQLKSVFNEELSCDLRREDGVLQIATEAGFVRAEYDWYGRLGALRFPHGGAEEFKYQALGRPETIIRQGEETRYEYDPVGCINSVATSTGKRCTFERDAQRRLVASKRNGTGPVRHRRYRYDAQGNRSRDDEAFTFGAGNRLLGTTGERFSYDLRGRLVERRTREAVRTQYRYSAEGYLQEVVRGKDRTSFRYDALGRRISKTFNGRETRYAWDGSRLSHEWRADGEERNYIYRPRSHIPLMFHRRKSGEEAWEVFFFHNDHRGCPQSVTDSRGRQVWSAEIGPFGELEQEQGQLDQPLALPGQYRDAETGLVYNYRRYFDPHLTIFITPDPLGHVAGDQLYAYAADPITKVDPLGLSDADYDNTKVTPHRIVTINGVKYVEFDAADAFSVPNPHDPKAPPNVNVGGSGVGPDGSPDTLAQIGPNGEVVVFEGRHRAIVSAVDDPIPEDRGGIPGKPGHLRYELSDTQADPADIGPRLSDLAADPDTLKAARSGHPSQRTT